MSTDMKIAAAPISWGICAPADWGYQMDYARVLREMASLGITASEIGPAGFLPPSPEVAGAALRDAGIEPIGTYLDLVMHRPDIDWRQELADTVRYVAAAGADTIVLAALSKPRAYESSEKLTDEEWGVLLRHLDEARGYAAEHGIHLAVHPHLATVIEDTDDVERVLEGSTISLCLDTGHSFAAGSDVAAMIRAAKGRVSHVHVKDVDAALVRRLQHGETSFMDAISDGIFKPFGDGDLPSEEIFAALEEIGFDGWLVLEQDVRLKTEPAAGEGPIRNVARSLAHINRLSA